MKTFSKLVLLCAGLMLAGQAAAADLQFGRDASMKDATKASMEKNRQEIAVLDFGLQDDFADAERGFIAPLLNGGKVVGKDGKVVWDLAAWDFDKEGKDMTSASQAPATVNPSLWRQYKLNMKSGLFKVTDRIYQVRGADISNLTVIEGDTGLIIADPLISEECAKAALDLYYAHRPKKPVKYVIYSHSHIDHYGGVKGIVSPEDVKAGKVQIVAPEGFLQAAVSENVNAGVAMGRRAHYMYGDYLKPGPKGHVGTGLGIMNSLGTTGIIPPTIVIEKDGQTVSMDGLDFVFLLAPNTEAPAEMHWYIPALKALTCAENCCHTMHNLYTLRGAKLRDPLSWSRSIDKTIAAFGAEAEVMYGMHHWPVWGSERVNKMLHMTSDLYRYINDQVLHLANQGKTMIEIAEEFRLPKDLAKFFALRGYYGSLNHNVKAVYNFYLGWFDGNPAHLHVLTPEASAKKYVEYMGGAKNVIKRAREDMAKGEYRWAAQVLDHVVFADPSNKEARLLEADALEQLGYQAESGPWRNFYLSGAMDLRTVGATATAPVGGAQGRAGMPSDLYFGWLGIRLNSARAEGRNDRVLLKLGEEGTWVLELANSVLHASKAKDSASVDAAVTLEGALSLVQGVLEGVLPLDKAKEKGLAISDEAKLASFVALFDRFSPNFNLVEP